MQNLSRHRGAVAALMLGAMLTTLVAPAAQAGSRRSVAGYRVEQVPAKTYVRRSSSGSNTGALIGGLIGGLVIGSVIASGANASVHAGVSSGYSYYDPYCETRYVSLDRYHSHLRGSGHPHVIRVMRAGRHHHDMCYENGGWVQFRGDWRSYRQPRVRRQVAFAQHPAHRWHENRYYCGGKDGHGHWRSADRCEDEYGRKKVDQIGRRWDGDRRWKREGDRSWDGNRRWRDRGDRHEEWRDRDDWKDRDRDEWKDRDGHHDDRDDDDGRWRDDEDWDR